MDNNWIFDQSSSAATQVATTPSSSANNHGASTANAATMNTHNAQESNSSTNNNTFTPSQTHSFLNFDSPSNHSESHNSHTNGGGNSNHHQNFNQQMSSLDYLDPTSHLKKDGEWSQLPDFNDIDMSMNFFQNDPNNNGGSSHDIILGSHMDHDEQQQLHNQHQHQPIIHQQQQQQHHHMNGNAASVPPTPQSFDVTHYANSSNSSFIQNFDSPQIDHQSQNTTATSIRPDVVFTPLVSPAVTPLESMINKNNNNQHNHNGNSNFFSPLTSPALEAKSPMRLKKSSTSSPQDDNNGNISANKKKYSKRKTPGNTPIVGPTIPGRIAKQSPIIKAKRSSSYANNIQHHQHSNSISSEYSEMTPLPDPSVESSTSSMAPPPSSKPPITRRRSTKKDSTQPATPATLMNFKLESSNSPVILPSNDRVNLPSQHELPSSQSRRSSEDNDTKKTSHKLAEQGRRNRMNQAIMDLGTLIPEELQATVSIPSKATTVELATSYILSLREEVRRLREGIESDESVSPLETK